MDIVLVGSLADIQKVLGEGFQFPAIAIPFGAADGDPCRYFASSGDVTEQALESLLDASRRMSDGIARFHLRTLTSGDGKVLPLSDPFELIAP